MSRAIPHDALARAIDALILDLDRQAAWGRIERKLKSTKALGFIVYEGPSPVDGAPIVCIVNALLKPSKNGKTGDDEKWLAQTWILRADMHPVEASETGADVSVCGDCKHRWFKRGACYVQIGKAPASVFKAYKRGRYLRATAQDLRDLGLGFLIRAGSYGDPSTVPAYVWAMLTPVTGYTHQWQEDRASEASGYAMASVDSSAERVKAKALGFRTFRVVPEGGDLEAGEIWCPAETKGLVCSRCQICLGGAKGPDVAIVVHGARKRSLRVIS